MTRLILVAGVLVAVLAEPHVFAQAPGSDTARPSFEVASVKPNKSADRGMNMMSQPGGRMTATNITLQMLILNAYKIQSFQIAEGPDWIRSDRFDINAKADSDPTPEQRQLMLQSLLAERFKLAVHRETREMPVYALVLARADGKPGPQLRPSDIDCEELARTKTKPPLPVTGPGPRPVAPCRMTLGGNGRLQAGALKIPNLVASLSSIVNRVVIDRTGLTGSFDLELQWSPEQSADTSGPSIFTALQEQLGLKLESTRGPVEVLVIDRVEQPSPD